MNLDVLYRIEKQNQHVEQQHRSQNIPALVRMFSREYRDAKRERHNS